MGDVVTFRVRDPNANLGGPLRPLAACGATCAIFDEHGPVARK